MGNNELRWGNPNIDYDARHTQRSSNTPTHFVLRKRVQAPTTNEFSNLYFNFEFQTTAVQRFKTTLLEIQGWVKATVLKGLKDITFALRVDRNIEYLVVMTT